METPAILSPTNRSGGLIVVTLWLPVAVAMRWHRSNNPGAPTTGEVTASVPDAMMMATRVASLLQGVSVILRMTWGSRWWRYFECPPRALVKNSVVEMAGGKEMKLTKAREAYPGR